MLSRANGGQAVVKQNTVELAQESQTFTFYNFSVEGWPMPRLWLAGLSSGARLDCVTVLHAGIGQIAFGDAGNDGAHIVHLRRLWIDGDAHMA